MKRKNIKGIFFKPMDNNAGPVVENDKLPAMPAVSEKQTGVISNPPVGTRLMPLVKETVIKPNKLAITKGVQMAPFDPKEQKKLKLDVPQAGYEDQLARPIRKIAGSGYVVLRMRVQNGQVSVINSRQVDGAFLEHENLIQNGITYEAFLKEDRIAIGSIPDYGEQRSFARPEGDPSQEGHHITILPSFDFNVKIAASKVTLKDLPVLKLNLYTFKEHVPEIKLSAAPLSQQFPKEVRLVAEMNGINIQQLRKDVKESIQRSFKK